MSNSASPTPALLSVRQHTKPPPQSRAAEGGVNSEQAGQRTDLGGSHQEGKEQRAEADSVHTVDTPAKGEVLEWDQRSEECGDSALGD